VVASLGFPARYPLVRCSARGEYYPPKRCCEYVPVRLTAPPATDTFRGCASPTSGASKNRLTTKGKTLYDGVEEGTVVKKTLFFRVRALFGLALAIKFYVPHY
jgi:hypothetical protein